jgi:hypothetical protein
MRPAFFSGSKFGLSMCPESHPNFHYACDFLIKLSPEVISVCRFVTNISHSDSHEKNRLVPRGDGMHQSKKSP